MSGCRMRYLGQAALQANQSEVLQAIQQKKLIGIEIAIGMETAYCLSAAFYFNDLPPTIKSQHPKWYCQANVLYSISACSS